MFLKLNQTALELDVLSTKTLQHPTTLESKLVQAFKSFLKDSRVEQKESRIDYSTNFVKHFLWRRLIMIIFNDLSSKAIRRFWSKIQNGGMDIIPLVLGSLVTF